MNYGELKALILSDAHRPDLTDEVADFVRRAEGLISRKLLAKELDASTTLTDADRLEAGSGIYTLPSGVIQVRRVVYDGEPLTPISANTVATYRELSSVRAFADLGLRIEFGGVPPAAAELELDYFGRLTALSADTDENALLSSHEDVYIHAGKFYLYQHTQDRELASDELSAFLEAVDDLNAELGRKLGAAVAAPMYDFGGGGGY